MHLKGLALIDFVLQFNKQCWLFTFYNVSRATNKISSGSQNSLPAVPGGIDDLSASK
jgi:hypothetical protein